VTECAYDGTSGTEPDKILAAKTRCSLIARPMWCSREHQGYATKISAGSEPDVSSYVRYLGLSEAVQKRDNSEPTCLTCAAHVKHAGLE
jgi:hypothetical protein